jgi:hypothetical protein
MASCRKPTEVGGGMIVWSEAGGFPHHHAEAEVLRLVKVAAVPVQPTAYIVGGWGKRENVEVRL